MFNLFSNHLVLTCSRHLPQPVLLTIFYCILFHLICLSTVATIGCSASLFTSSSSPSIKHSLLPCLFVASATATHYSQQDQQSSQNCPIMTDKKLERTFIAIKPDGVQRGLIGTIIERFERRGYKLIALKLVQPSRQHLEVHYQDLKTKPFFPHLIEYMLSGPIVAMVWQGLDIVRQGRVMIGATNPLESAPGSLRGDFAIQTGRNIVHGSDAVESAMREIAHWFRDDELTDYVAANTPLIYE